MGTNMYGLLYIEKRFSDLPDLQKFIGTNMRVYIIPILKPAISFEGFQKDTEVNPLSASSGKIERFS